jgi:uncharacterized protein
MPNRLAAEHSPYLLQHADNPVDWWPWGDEAFAEARRTAKPIFLSVGYSTCHWCHVMAHESFEDRRIADVLNREFVPVKVDREERPDIDRVYMTFVQATTGSGGWPMSVWLTPALAPFYGGTYFPPETRWGRPGFLEVLHAIARAWREERARVEQSAAAVVSDLRRVTDSRDPAAAEIASAETLALGVRQFQMSYDARQGGFGGGPKFPRPSELLFLLREHARTGDASARDMTLHTLRAMALGGMRDHIGGGFHRYSVDGEWRVPHFEKMLYDQAQLVIALLEAAQVSGDRFFAQIADDTLQYVSRELTSPEGGFYSAEDADSLPPGASSESAHPQEGAFYVWTAAELRDRLGDDYEPFALRFGIEEDGNAPSDPQGEFTGKNLLYSARSISEVASALNRSADDVAEALGRARLILFAARLDRPRPHLDDKIITAWNGLMIAAFARAARVLGSGAFDVTDRPDMYLESARQAARFIHEQLWEPDRLLLARRSRRGESGVAAYAEDYASLAFGLLELFQADGDVAWLEWASALQDALDAGFWDEDEGGWFSTRGNDPSVLLRLKEDHDGAEPSATALGIMNLLTLTHLVPDPVRDEKLNRALARFGVHLGERARAVPMVAAALSTFHAGVGQIVLVGQQDAPDFQTLHRTFAQVYRPFLVVVPVDVRRDPRRVASRLPFIGPLEAREGRATAYVCRDFACQAPTTSADQLLEVLAVSS